MVKIYKLKLTILQQEIMRFLSLNSGKEFNARGLALGLDVSQPAIMKALPKLDEEELIIMRKDKDSGRFSIKLNINKKEIIDFKRVENLRLIYESGLADFLIDSFPSSLSIILFGSYSLGEDNYDSDIDIAIIGEKEKMVELEGFEKIFGKKIFLHFYKNLKDINKNLRENICNGILLKGGIEL